MTKQKQSSKTTILPKTLWGFYFKHAIHGNGWMILAGAILSFIVDSPGANQGMAWHTLGSQSISSNIRGSDSLCP